MNISIYQKVLVELAKQIWREKNPNKLRLPRNFERYFQLQIGDICEGSAIAELPRFEEDLPQLFGSEAPGDIFDLAQDQLVEIIDCANDNRPIPRLSSSVRKEIHALRKNMRESEELIITRGRMPRESDEHRISNATRERITRQIRQRRPEHVSSFGVLSAVSEAPAEITVTSERGAIKFPVNFQTARLVYNGKNGRLVDFNINAIVDYDGQIVGVESINSVQLIEEDINTRRAVDRIDALSGIEGGWHEGEGLEVSPISILTAKDISRLVCSIAPTAGIFPTLDGEISIEYDRNDLEWTVLIRDMHVIVEVQKVDDDEGISSRFRGVSSGLIKMLLSENGIVDG